MKGNGLIDRYKKQTESTPTKKEIEEIYNDLSLRVNNIRRYYDLFGGIYRFLFGKIYTQYFLEVEEFLISLGSKDPVTSDITLHLNIGILLRDIRHLRIDLNGQSKHSPYF